LDKKRVIIADRSQDLLEGIRGLLETVFDSVVMVADTGSLVDAVKRLDVDLVVMDQSLYAKQGLNVIKAIKSVLPGVKVIVMSIHDEAAALDKALAAGAEGFVLKREAATDLIPAVEAVLEGRTFASVIHKS
jgi:DNA-binding NarL/FixJ family response regulator